MRPKSFSIYESACKVSPGGVHSPVRAFHRMGIHPLIAERGQGDTLYDVDGKKYIDYCCSWGALILGHAHPGVVASACAQIHKGSSFGLSTEEEEMLARRIVELVPSIEKVRFVSSGTEANMSALRLARGYTGRPSVVKFSGHYHGHADSLLVQAGSGARHYSVSKGVSEDIIKNTYCLPFNDIQTSLDFLRSHNDIAAVILEPIACNMGVVPADPMFLQMLREETQKSGILLIFDEVITGFRLGLSGAQGYYGIIPDITCLGKILGGGFPAAAFGGRKEIMDELAPLGEVYQAGTLSGNPVAMAAGRYTLMQLERPGFYDELTAKTEIITKPLQERCLDVRVEQVGSLFTPFFVSEDRYKEFFIYLLDRGIYIPPCAHEACFVSSAHTQEHLEYTRDTMLAFFKDK